LAGFSSAVCIFIFPHPTLSDIFTGGISLLSFQHGFGSDNILNYELVLSNGTILHANASSHPDLFWALKLGSSNFGVVTRFDVRTYPLKPQVWGGIRAYPVTPSDTPTLISNWVSFARSSAAKREELQALILGQGQKGEEIATIWHASVNDVPSPPLSTAPPLFDGTRMTTLLDLVGDLGSSDFSDKRRNRWYTLTVKLDAPFIWDVFEHAKGMFDGLELEFDGMRWDVLFQPVTQGFVSASEETGGNPFRSVLMESADDLASKFESSSACVCVLEILISLPSRTFPYLLDRPHARLGYEPRVAHPRCMERIPRPPTRYLERLRISQLCE
jgi:hypothetical protein